jgi:uncharacterized protein involved in oxidation of intracellular sulfur
MATSGKERLMKRQFLIVINDGPYGNERAYNALRLAIGLVKQPETDVRIFLLGDGVQCAVREQDTPQGYYNIERMVSSIVRRGAVST